MDSKTLSRFLDEVNQSVNNGIASEFRVKPDNIKKLPLLEVKCREQHFELMLLMMNQVVEIDCHISSNDVGSTEELLLQLLVVITDLIRQADESNKKALIVKLSYLVFYCRCILNELRTSTNHDLLFGEVLNIDREFHGNKQMANNMETMQFESALKALLEQTKKQIDLKDLENSDDELDLEFDAVAKLIDELIEDPVKAWFYLTGILKLVESDDKDKASFEVLTKNPGLLMINLLQLNSGRHVVERLKLLY